MVLWYGCGKHVLKGLGGSGGSGLRVTTDLDLFMTDQIDLTKAVALRCIEKMTEAGYSPTPTNDEDAIYLYFSVRHRRVRRQPRTVHKAAYTIPAHLVAGEKYLLTKVSAGDDLWPHQSRKIVRLSIQDGMLNDYGVQHFHLGTSLKVGTDLIEGTKELLFAIVTDYDFYAIGIYDHNSWVDQTVLDVVHDNWPHLTEPYTIKSSPKAQFLGLRHDYTADEVADMRAAGINVPQRRSDGSIQIMMGGGIAGDQSSVAVRRATDSLLIYLEELKRELKAELVRHVKSGKFSGDVPVRIIWRDDPPPATSSLPIIDFYISDLVDIPSL